MIIELQGARKAPVFQTNACGHCEYTEASVIMFKKRGARKIAALFRTEDDAKEAYELGREAAIKEAWAKAWTKFKCQNNACKNKDACNADIKYIIAHTEIVEDNKKRRRFKVEITIGREIRCVATPGNNPDPTMIDFREYDGDAEVPGNLPETALRPTRETDHAVAFASMLLVDVDPAAKGKAKASR